MTIEERAIHDSLIAWREDGVADPIIPAYVDEDGDGKPDYWGLDTFGRLELRKDGSDGFNVALAFGSTATEGP